MQHLDEGTIHAWLDGQLPRDEAEAAEAHVAECRQCADAVAEARGLIAASSRILMSLDSVPRDVAPKATPVVPAVQTPLVATAARSAEPNDIVDVRSRAASAAQPARRPRRWLSGPSLAAAAAIVVAAGTFTLSRFEGNRVVSSADSEGAADMSGPRVDQPSPAVVSAPATVAPSTIAPAAPTPAPAPTALGARAAANDVAPGRPSNEMRELAGVRAEANQARARSPQPQRVDSFSFSAERDNAKRLAKVAEPVDAKDEVARAKERGAVLTDSASLRRQLAAAPAPPPAAVAQSKADTSTIVATRRPEPEKTLSDRRVADAASATPTTGIIRGRVTDGNGTGLVSAMIMVAGTQIGVTTDSAGQFALAGIQPGTHRLTVRRIGYDQVSRDLVVGAGEATMADVVLRPVVNSLSEVVVTGTGATRQRASVGSAIARSPAANEEKAPGAAVTAQQSNAVGCYDMGITPSAQRTRVPLRQTPRRVALDAEIVPSNADGVWYRARDLARATTIQSGLWRPVGTDGIELEWTYGMLTARIRLTGAPTSMMRGTVEELDRANGTGESGSVVSVKTACPR